MNKKSKNKKIVKILIIAGLLIVLWLLFIYPLIKFNSNEKLVKEATIRYFSINKNLLPQEGNIKTVEVQTLVDKKFITDLRTAYNNKTCDVKDSFVKIKRDKGEYKYYVYLKCGIFSSNIDHKGPIITLNGDSVINIDRGETFTDPGIKSVVDNSDGVIENSKVAVKGTVDTNITGDYTITYSVVDNLENKTVVERKVIVTENLTKTIKKALGNDLVYKGDVNNNYIRFSGGLFRIVGLDSDGNIKIVSNEDISQVDYNSLDNWLNNYYYNHLNEKSKEYLVKNYEFCSDVVSKNDVSKKTNCNELKNKANVSVLSVDSYNNSLKDGKTYLYPDTINWTSSSLNDKKAWTTRKYFFDIDSKYLDYSKTEHYNVRPVLVIKKDTKVKSGDGSFNDPYDIGDFKVVKAGSSVTKTRSGEYVSYKNTLYRVVLSDDNGYTKVISDKSISLDLEEFTTPSIYNPEEKGSFAYYLENETSKYINSKIFVKHKVVVPIYKNKASFNGKKETKTYSIKFAAPSLYDMYSSNYNPTYYIESSKNEDVVYASSSNGTVLDSGLDSTRFITKFTGYLKKDVVIVSGSGTRNDPYILSY